MQSAKKNNSIYIGVEKDILPLAERYISQDISLYTEDNNQRPSIELSIAFPEATVSTSITGGTTNLYNSVANCYFSTGVCGYYNGKPAILTCGHIYQSLGDTIENSSGSEIGNVVQHCYGDGTTGDYEIIEVTNTSEFEITNTIANQYYVKGTYPNPSEGVIVKTHGKASGYAYGEVYQTNISVKHSGSNYTIYGMTRVKVKAGSCTHRDSGAPFFTSSSYSYTLFAGILSSYSTADDVTYIAFTPWTKMSGSGFSILTS